MQFLVTSFSTGLVLAIAFSSAFAQNSPESGKKNRDDAKTAAAARAAETETKSAPAEQDLTPIEIYLVGGGQMQVDEVTESADGVWYKRGSVTSFLEKSRVARIKRPEEIRAADTSAATAGDWNISKSTLVEDFFMATFNRRLPTTAFGQSDLHTRWGLDHRQGIDVGLHPDSPEGRVLINFLGTEKIPFLAFRGPIPNVATGPHIHIGRGSHRLPIR